MITTKIAASLRAVIAGLALAFLVLPAAPLSGLVPVPNLGGHAFADETCAGSHIRGSSFGNCGGGGGSNDDDEDEDDDSDDPNYGPSCGSGEVWDSVSGRCEPTHCTSGRSRDLSCFPDIEDDYDDNIRPVICKATVVVVGGAAGGLACFGAGSRAIAGLCGAATSAVASGLDRCEN